MAIDKKRKISKPTAGQPKRRKTQQVQQVERAPASLDSLRWKPVEVPDMFDDLEGFYGLEEIDGVDIVKEGDSIKFVSPSSSDDLNILTDRISVGTKTSGSGVGG